MNIWINSGKLSIKLIRMDLLNQLKSIKKLDLVNRLPY